MTSTRLASSFRDPAGFVFEEQGVIYRQVNRSYASDYDRLVDTGLYPSLVDAGLLVPHEDVEFATSARPEAYKVIKPTRVEFISYPYEWCFTQLKMAALATLEIQRRALAVGMALKDASAFNIQFVSNRPRLIDTLSFTIHREGDPWVAYGQFCRHFLAPLLLMRHLDLRLGLLGRAWLDGVPLDLASRLLPAASWLRPGTLIHLHLHAQSERRLAGNRTLLTAGRQRVPTKRLDAYLAHLQGVIEGLRAPKGATVWSSYGPEGHYGASALADKAAHVARFIATVRPKTVWDLGANRAAFSRLAAEAGADVVAFDADDQVIEQTCQALAAERNEQVLPLVMDLTNPSGAAGWAHEERLSLVDRGPVDLVMMLALLHHLVIVNNLPFERVARFCSTICRFLVVEFVGPGDPQLAEMMVGRAAASEPYDEGRFSAAFRTYFRIIERVPLAGTSRVLYLMEKESRF